MVAIKGLCREANVAKIDVGPKGAVVAFRADHFANPGGLVAFIQKNAVAWRLRPDQKVVVKGEWETPEQRLAAAERVLGELARLAKAAGPPPDGMAFRPHRAPSALPLKGGAPAATSPRPERSSCRRRRRPGRR